MKRRFFIIPPMFTKNKTGINYLTQVPVRMELEFTDDDGKITLLLPKFKNERFIQWFVPKRKPTQIKFHLDETGSQVWRAIDGHKPVEMICNDVRDYLTSKGKPTDQVEERVTSFLTILSRNGFISFNEAPLQSGE